MTEVSIIMTEEGVYKSFSAEGHSGFAEQGEDIVCASISALVVNALNSIEYLTDDGIEWEVDENTGYVRFEFSSDISDKSKLLMDSLLLGLQGIEEEYGNEYIRLILKEV